MARYARRFARGVPAAGTLASCVRDDGAVLGLPSMPVTVTESVMADAPAAPAAELAGGGPPPAAPAATMQLQPELPDGAQVHGRKRELPMASLASALECGICIGLVCEPISTPCGRASHWREFCRSADALSPSLLIRLLKVEGGAAE